jgi:molecular chaperone DnaJ
VRLYKTRGAASEACRGLGVTRRQEEVTIKIPAGMQNGEMIRLTGMGEAVPGGVAGDLYVKVHVKSHPVFRREANNLVMELGIKLSDALLGAEYAVQTLDGPIKVKIPAGITFGETLRVKGKGVMIDRTRRGDLLIKVNITLPSKLSRQARKLIEDLRNEGV